MKKKRDLQESKLQQLENSVEGEERKWQDKAEALTVELQQVRGQGHGPVITSRSRVKLSQYLQPAQMRFN